MNQICAKCEKTVYPVEKLTCLDKHWHKGCFKCEECGVTLTLKTCKGYNKIPYCNTHYPKTKHTQIADTIEGQRLKKVNENLSQANYHKDYNETVKGKKLNVAEDPELARAKKNQEMVSQNKYHGKDPTNPSSTPLSRPYYSTPGYMTSQTNGHGPEGEAEPPAPKQDPVPVEPPSPVKEPEVVLEPPREPSPEPPREPSPEPPAEPSPVPVGEPSPEPEDIAPPTPEPPMSPDTAQTKADEEEQLDPPVEVTPAPPEENGEAKYVALYDYRAADDDEIDLHEGDVIVDGEIVAEGWMTGTNTRSGLHGMLPSNYVEPT